MRIITLTLNPALDKTATLPELKPGELNRLANLVVDAGGKGVNVSKMIAALGGRSLASGLAGGGSGREIAQALDRAGIAHDFVPIAGTTRTNLKVLDRDNRLTELNEPGPVVSHAELAALEGRVSAWANPETLFIFSGSLPGGVEAGAYARLIRLARAAGAKAFLDADGPAFAQALEASPDFIKPNRYELLQYFGEKGGDADLPLLLGLSRKLLAKGVGRLAVSMGAEGALFVSAREGAYHAPGLRVAAQSSVGAGDSMVGAVAHGTAQGLPWREVAALAMAASAGAVTTEGTKPPSREVVDELLCRVELRPIV